MKPYSSKKYCGVFWIPSTVRRLPDGSPDRTYYIRYKLHGRKIEEKIGWASEGVTEELAARARAEKLLQVRKTGIVPRVLTMDEVFQRLAANWHTTCKTADKEIAVYNQHLKPKFGHRTLSSIRPLEFEDLAASLLQKYSPRYVRRILGIARQIFNRAIKWEIHVGNNPVSPVDLPRMDDQRMRYLTIEEIHCLLEVLKPKPKVYLMAYLSIFYGLRPSEIFNLKWSEVDLEEKHVILLDTKNRENRCISLDDESVFLFQNLKNSDPTGAGLVFKNSHGERYNKIPKVFKTAVRQLGLNHGVTHRRNRVVFYTLRHTYATYIKALGYSDSVLKDMMGHRSIQTTQRYAKMMPSLSSQISQRLKEFIQNAQNPDTIQDARR